MSYLLGKMLIYVLGALMIGMVVGWISCGREQD